MCTYLVIHGIKHLAINNILPSQHISTCYSMQYNGSSSLISCKKQMIRIEFLSLQGKPKHTTWWGTPSPHTSTVPIDSPSAERGSPPWRTMPHWPQLPSCSDRTCTHHNQNGRPHLRSREEGNLRAGSLDTLDTGIRTLIGLPINGMCSLDTLDTGRPHLRFTWHTCICTLIFTWPICGQSACGIGLSIYHISRHVFSTFKLLTQVSAC
jgi:hypothetical protein